MMSVIISLNNLVMHVTKIIVFFLRQTRHADYYHRYYNRHRDRHVGFHIWDRNCYDYKKIQFSLKGPGITPI